MADPNNSKEKLERLVIWFALLGQLKKLISAPKAERENLEKYIENLLDGDATTERL